MDETAFIESINNKVQQTNEQDLKGFHRKH